MILPHTVSFPLHLFIIYSLMIHLSAWDWQEVCWITGLGNKTDLIKQNHPPSLQQGWNQLGLTQFTLLDCSGCCCLASVLCMKSPSDLGDRRLFMPAFQVGRLRCALCRGLLNAKSHFTLALMSPGKRRGVRTGRWCLQMRTPQTASHPDTRCWFDYGVACKSRNV